MSRADQGLIVRAGGARLLVPGRAGEARGRILGSCCGQVEAEEAIGAGYMLARPACVDMCGSRHAWTVGVGRRRKL